MGQNEWITMNPTAKITYFQLPVTDLERAISFYTGSLGMDLIRRQDFGEANLSFAYVGYGDDTAMIGLRHNWRQGGALSNLSETLISIRVGDWNRFLAHAESSGTSVSRPGAKTSEGERVAFVRDPDGYEIQLVEEILKPTVPKSTALAVPPKIRTKNRILDAAGRGFRLHGFGGIGVDGLAKEAGVTSGAFYGHFKSKEEAFRAAVVEGLADFTEGVGRFQAENGDDWLDVLSTWYLSEGYLADVAGSCALPSLSPDVVRSSEAVRSAYEVELRRLASSVQSGLEGKPDGAAWVVLALLVGGVTLARAVENPELSAKIADSVRGAVSEVGRQR